MECLDKGAEELLNEGVVACLDNNIKYILMSIYDTALRNVLIFLFTPLLEYILKGTLYVQCILYHDYMKKGGWYDTYVHFSCDFSHHHG